MPLAPRTVVVHRRTELDELVERHGTRGQAEFFLRTRGRTLAEVQDRHDTCAAVLQHVAAAIPIDWRRGSVERGDLDRFLFDADDIIVVVGLNPEPDRNPGVLVRHPPTSVGSLLAALSSGRATMQQRTLCRAETDDGQDLSALNEIYLGHPSHQSARYRLTKPGADPERQSSSGIIVSTGTGTTGWCASIAQERHSRLALPDPEDRALAWFVREAWPSPATETTHTEGLLTADQRLVITAEADSLVLFGDGLERDRLTVGWGQDVRIGIDGRTLRLVTG